MQCHHVLFLAKLRASRVILAPHLKCTLLSVMECYVMVCGRPNHLQNQEFCNAEYSSHCTHELLIHFASLIKQCLSPPAPAPGPDKMPLRTGNLHHFALRTHPHPAHIRYDRIISHFLYVNEILLQCFPLVMPTCHIFV